MKLYQIQFVVHFLCVMPPPREAIDDEEEECDKDDIELCSGS